MQKERVEKEAWRFNPKFGHYYAISTHGRVCHYKYRKVDKKMECYDQEILTPFSDERGLLLVWLWVIEDEQFRPYPLHRLVLETFCGPIFKDGNPENCKLSNLQWANTQPT